GAKILLEGGRISDAEHKGGCFLRPFVYRMEQRAGVRSIREEVFGPHVALIPFKSNEDAIRINNDTDYGLSMAVITEDYRTMRLFRDECEYGMGYVNLPSIGAEVHLPFGGVKKSGNGHPSAAGLIETVTHKTAWTVNHGTEVKMAQGLTTDIEGGPASLAACGLAFEPPSQGDVAMQWQFDNCTVPHICTALPGPLAQALLERDQRY